MDRVNTWVKSVSREGYGEEDNRGRVAERSESSGFAERSSLSSLSRPKGGRHREPEQPRHGHQHRRQKSTSDRFPLAAGSQLYDSAEPRAKPPRPSQHQQLQHHDRDRQYHRHPHKHGRDERHRHHAHHVAPPSRSSVQKAADGPRRSSGSSSSYTTTASKYLAQDSRARSHRHDPPIAPAAAAKVPAASASARSVKSSRSSAAAAGTGKRLDLAQEKVRKHRQPKQDYAVPYYEDDDSIDPRSVRGLPPAKKRGKWMPRPAPSASPSPPPPPIHSQKRHHHHRHHHRQYHPQPSPVPAPMTAAPDSKSKAKSSKRSDDARKRHRYHDSHDIYYHPKGNTGAGSARKGKIPAHFRPVQASRRDHIEYIDIDSDYAHSHGGSMEGYYQGDSTDGSSGSCSSEASSAQTPVHRLDEGGTASASQHTTDSDCSQRSSSTSLSSDAWAQGMTKQHSSASGSSSGASINSNRAVADASDHVQHVVSGSRNSHHAEEEEDSCEEDSFSSDGGAEERRYYCYDPNHRSSSSSILKQEVSSSSSDDKLWTPGAKPIAPSMRLRRGKRKRMYKVKRKPRWVYYYREGTGPAYGEKAPDSANENDVDDGGEAPPKKKVKRQPYTTRDMTRVGKEHMKHCGSVQYYSVLCPICNAYVERHFNLPKHLQKHLNQIAEVQDTEEIKAIRRQIEDLIAKCYKEGPIKKMYAGLVVKTKCTICNRPYNDTLGAREQHMRRCHPSECGDMSLFKRERCYVCMLEFPPQEIDAHFRSHMGDAGRTHIYCYRCIRNNSVPAPFQEHAEMKKHFQEQHPETHISARSVFRHTAPHVAIHCLMCRCFFSGFRCYKQHIVPNHQLLHPMPELPAECSLKVELAKDKFYPLDNGVWPDMHMDQDGRLRCVPCEQSFKMFTSFRRHTRIVHSHTKQLTCEHCHRNFETPGGLNKHRNSFCPELGGRAGAGKGKGKKGMLSTWLEGAASQAAASFAASTGAAQSSLSQNQAPQSEHDTPQQTTHSTAEQPPPQAEQEQHLQQEKQQPQQPQQEKLLQEQQLKEQQLKEQQLKEQQLKEQQLKEQQLKEQQLKEQQLKEQQLKEQQLKEQQLEEQQLEEQHSVEENQSTSSESYMEDSSNLHSGYFNGELAQEDDEGGFHCATDSPHTDTDTESTPGGNGDYQHSYSESSYDSEQDEYISRDEREDGNNEHDAGGSGGGHTGNIAVSDGRSDNHSVNIWSRFKHRESRQSNPEHTNPPLRHRPDIKSESPSDPGKARPLTASIPHRGGGGGGDVGNDDHAAAQARASRPRAAQRPGTWSNSSGSGHDAELSRQCYVQKRHTNRTLKPKGVPQQTAWKPRHGTAPNLRDLASCSTARKLTTSRSDSSSSRLAGQTRSYFSSSQLVGQTQHYMPDVPSPFQHSADESTSGRSSPLSEVHWPPNTKGMKGVSNARVDNVRNNQPRSPAGGGRQSGTHHGSLSRSQRGRDRKVDLVISIDKLSAARKMWGVADEQEK